MCHTTVPDTICKIFLQSMKDSSGSISICGITLWHWVGLEKKDTLLLDLDDLGKDHYH